MASLYGPSMVHKILLYNVIMFVTIIISERLPATVVLFSCIIVSGVIFRNVAVLQYHCCNQFYQYLTSVPSSPVDNI